MDSLELTMRRRKDSYLWDREEALTAWMHENARVAYVVDQQPWLVENELLAHGVLALNIKGRRTDPFVQTLLDRRSAAQAAALAD